MILVFIEKMSPAEVVLRQETVSLSDDDFGYFGTLTTDVDAVFGIEYTQTLQVVVLYRSILIGCLHVGYA